MKIYFVLWLSLCINANIALAQTYKYDNNHQLTEIKYDNGTIITIQYDANGNRTSYTVTPGISLSLTLVSFNAQKSGQQVLLTWTTTNEINTDKFEIEHSSDGVSFVRFATVAARGSTSGSTDYSTIHCCPLEGVNYYRLKMIDKDGSFKYSPIRKVVFDGNTQMNIYPNPAGDNQIVTISFTKPFTTDATITVFTSAGSQVYIGILRRGENRTQINTVNFSTGSYFVKVKAGEVEYKREFVKQ